MVSRKLLGWLCLRLRFALASWQQAQVCGVWLYYFALDVCFIVQYTFAGMDPSLLSRYGLDALLALPDVDQPVFQAQGVGATQKFLPLLQLTDPRTVDAFRTVNDGVMGGVSDGGLQFSVTDGCGVFKGMF